MWWTAASDQPGPVSIGPAPTIEDALASHGLAETDGLWTDAARTVGVARSAAGLFVGWIDVGWVTAEQPFAELRDVAHLPIHGGGPELEHDLPIALSEALAIRSERLRRCERCGEQFVPGQMHGSACCPGRTPPA